jgi:hypothetical protein
MKILSNHQQLFVTKKKSSCRQVGGGAGMITSKWLSPRVRSTIRIVTTNGNARRSRAA